MPILNKISEEVLQTIFLNAGDGIFLVEDQKIIEANPRGCEMFGYAYEEIIGLPLMEQIPADEIEHITGKLMLLAQTKFVISESAFYRKDRTRMDVEISGRMLDNGQILGIMRDITQRKLAAQSLVDSEQKFRSLVEHSPDGIFLVDEQGRIVEWNRGQEVITEITQGEAIGRPVWEVQLQLAPEHVKTPETLSMVQAFFEDMLSFGNAHAPTPLTEQVIQTSSGAFRHLEMTLYAYESRGGYRIGGVTRDITRRKQAETALREAHSKLLENERLMASFEERDRLARELHDSIGQTFGYINMQSEATRDLVKSGNTERAHHILARLSEVAQEAHQDLRRYILELKSSQPIFHQEFFAALQRYCQHYEESYLFTVALHLPPSLPEVLASAQVETHLTYIIREAVGNARRYSGEKSASIAISIEEDFVQAVIEDRGLGFNSEYQKNDRRKGTHFGLRIMRERAEEVGGTVEVNSAPQQGTRVTVRLPRKLSTTEAFTARVVIVDDHPLFIDGLRNMLAGRSVHVIGVAHDGLQAREVARTLQPDLILMDINMPRMNGLEATRVIKAEHPGIKIVMLTTSMDEKDIMEALQAGASGYLPKGLSADEFMTRLREIASGRTEFSMEVAKQLMEMFAQQNANADKLTDRQMEILRLVSQGVTYREIGERLYLTERTVKYHMGEILARLHLKGRQEVEEYARRRGLK